MKTLIFTLLVAICAFNYANASDAVENEIKVLNSLVNFLSKSFQVHGDNNWKELDTNVHAIRKPEEDDLRGKTYLVVAQVRTAVDTAKEGGKEVESCYTTAEKALTKLRKDGLKSILHCVADSMQMGQAVFALSGHILQNIDAVETKIKNIHKTCKEAANETVRNLCIKSSVENIRVELENVTKDMQVSRGYTRQAATDVPLLVESCAKDVNEKTSDSVDSIKSEADKCIAG